MNASNAYIPVFSSMISKKRETLDTYTLSYEAPEGFAFQPGQFNMIYVPGIGEVPISISGSPSNKKEIIHTIRDVGSVTSGIVNTLTQTGLRGPYGHGWPMEEAKGKDVLLIAGGIGLAPLRPAIYSILENRKEYGKMTLLYGARTPRDLLYENELKEWLARFDMQVEISVDKDDPDWRGHVGVITRFISSADFAINSCISMICGPEIMIRYSARELETMGVKDECIYVSMERNMKCGLGHCGHCQYGTSFVCKDGPVFAYSKIKDLFLNKEI